MSAEQFRSVVQIEQDILRAFGITDPDKWKPGLRQRIETLVLQAFQLGQRDARKKRATAETEGR